MYTNKLHPNYNIVKEVMCMMPLHKYAVEMNSIAKDLGISRERLGICMRALQKDYKLVYKPGKNDMAVGASAESFEAIQAVAEKYYADVYGEGGAA